MFKITNLNIISFIKKKKKERKLVLTCALVERENVLICFHQLSDGNSEGRNGVKRLALRGKSDLDQDEGKPRERRLRG